jgi:hypothetical protein
MPRRAGEYRHQHNWSERKMKNEKKVATWVAGGTALGLVIGASAAYAALSGLVVPIATGPVIAGGGPYTQIGIGGDPAKGEASSVIIEREGQRAGVADDDGPALIVKSNQFAAARFEAFGNAGAKPIEAVSNRGSVFTNTGVVNTNGTKKDNVAITSVGSIVIKGKDATGAAALDSVRLAVEGGKLYAKFANGNEIVLATEND